MTSLGIGALFFFSPAWKGTSKIPSRPRPFFIGFRLRTFLKFSLVPVLGWKNLVFPTKKAENWRQTFASDQFSACSGVPARAWTGGLGLRRLALYPTELRRLIVFWRFFVWILTGFRFSLYFVFFAFGGFSAAPAGAEFPVFGLFCTPFSRQKPVFRGCAW